MASALAIRIALQDAISGGLKKIQAELGLTSSNAAKVQGNMGGMAKSFVLSTAAGLGLYKSVNEIAGVFVRFIKSSYELSSAMEQSRIAFTSMLGSAQEADKMLNNLKTFAASTPFEFMELQGAAKRMFAYGFSAEEVIPKLKAVGDAAAALGGGGEMINRITLALGQMQAKGKVSGEELRQLSEAGIPALKYLADAAHMTTSEFTDFQKKGVVPADQAIRALIQGMEKDFGGMMVAQIDTAMGQMSMLADEMAFLKIALGDTFREEILETTKYIISMVKELRAWVEEVGVTRDTTKTTVLRVGEGALDQKDLLAAFQKEMSRRKRDPSRDGVQRFLDKMDEALVSTDPYLASQWQGSMADNTRYYAELLSQTKEGQAALLELNESSEAKHKEIADRGMQWREGFNRSKEAEETVHMDLTQLTRKQMMKNDEEFAKKAIALAQEYQGLYKGVLAQIHGDIKDNAKDIINTRKELFDAEKQFAGLVAGRAKNISDIKDTRRLLLGELDALTGLENKTGVYVRSLGELDGQLRTIEGSIHAYQDRQAAGQELTAAETEDLLKLGKARLDLLPGLTMVSGWTTQQADRNAALSTSNRDLQKDIDDLIAHTELYGETTQKDKDNLAKWQSQIDKNSEAMGVNSVAQNTAAGTTKLLTDSYEDNFKQLGDLIKQSGGYDGATDTQKQKLDELKTKLKELLDEEKRLTQGVTEELRKRIVRRELEAAAIGGLDQEEAAALKAKMFVFGIAHDETLNRDIAEMLSAEGLQVLHEELTKLYKDDLGAKTLAEKEYTRINGELIQQGIIPNIQDMIDLTLEQTAKILLLSHAITSIPEYKRVHIHTVYTSEGARQEANRDMQLLIDAKDGGDVPVIYDTKETAADLVSERQKVYNATTGSMGQNATGGAVTGNQSYLVGEHGAEIFTPYGGRSGSITSNLSASRMQDTPSYTSNFNIANITVTGVQDVQALYRALQKEAKARGKVLAN